MRFKSETIGQCPSIATNESPFHSSCKSELANSVMVPIESGIGLLPNHNFPRDDATRQCRTPSEHSALSAASSQEDPYIVGQESWPAYGTNQSQNLSTSAVGYHANDATQSSKPALNTPGIIQATQGISTPITQAGYISDQTSESMSYFTPPPPSLVYQHMQFGQMSQDDLASNATPTYPTSRPSPFAHPNVGHSQTFQVGQPRSQSYGIANPPPASQISRRYWQIPSKTLSPSCPLESLVLGFMQDRKALAAEGVQGSNLVGPARPCFTNLLYRDRVVHSHPVSTVASQIVNNITNLHSLPVRAASLYLTHLYLQVCV